MNKLNNKHFLRLTVFLALSLCLAASFFMLRLNLRKGQSRSSFTKYCEKHTESNFKLNSSNLLSPFSLLGLYDMIYAAYLSAYFTQPWCHNRKQSVYVKLVWQG